LYRSGDGALLRVLVTQAEKAGTSSTGTAKVARMLMSRRTKGVAGWTGKLLRTRETT
jgi:hypothetical protein